MPRPNHLRVPTALALCLALTGVGCALDVADPEPVGAVSSEIRRLRGANYYPTLTANDTGSAQNAGTLGSTCTAPPPPPIEDTIEIHYDLTLTSRIIDQLLAVDDAGGTNTLYFTTQSGTSTVGAGMGQMLVPVEVTLDGADVWRVYESGDFPPSGTTRQDYAVPITRDTIDTMVPGGVLRLGARGWVLAEAGGCQRINQSIITWYFDGQQPRLLSRP